MASTIANANRDKKKKAKPYQPKDFMPKFEKKRQTWQEQLKLVEVLNQAFGGDDKRQDKGRD